MSTDKNFNVNVTPQAIATITAMSDELSRIRSLFGDSDERTVKAATSLAFSLCQMLMLRPVSISSDGNLDLHCNSEHLTYGVNYTGASYDKEHHVGEWSVNS